MRDLRKEADQKAHRKNKIKKAIRVNFKMWMSSHRLYPKHAKYPSLCEFEALVSKNMNNWNLNE